MGPENKQQTGIIYCAICLVNNKRYIGQTSITLEKRKIQHYNQAFKYGYDNLFQRALRKHGWDNFVWNVIAICYSKEELNKSEVNLISSFKTKENAYGYNMTEGGTGGDIIGRLPNKDEIYKKIGTTNSGQNNPFYGKTHSLEVLEKISSASKGRIASKETREKRSKSLKGRIFPNEVKAKISKANSGKNNPMFGQHTSEETKHKQSEAMKAHWAKKRKQDS